MKLAARPRRLLALLVFATPVVAQGGSPSQIRVDFDSLESGQPPARFTLETAGPGGPAAWSVRDDATAPSGKHVLMQTSAEKMERRFPVCVYDGLLTHNVIVSVRFKLVSGTIAQAAGLIARFQDAENYWALWVDAVSGRVGIDTILDGQPREVAKAPASITAGSWHTLKLALAQQHFQGFLDGERLIEVNDMTLGETGEVGLWTRADSVTAFDDFTIEESDAGH